MERIIINTTLLKSEAIISNTACTWENVEGVLPPSETTSENPEDYVFVLNGVEYQCNYFLHGDTKFKAAYKTSGHDTIMLEYIIASGLSNIKIRTDDEFEVLSSNSFELIEKNVPEQEAPQYVLINLGGKAVAKVKYQNGEFTLESEG